MYYLFCLIDSGDMRVDRSLRVYFAKDDAEARAKAENFAKICREAGFFFRNYVVDRVGGRVCDEKLSD